jgi:hypothetical protein
MRVTAQHLSIKKIATLIIFLCSYNNMHAQEYGCPDPAAENYNDSVTMNDGSCTYKNVSITPTLNADLTTAVNETSGLIWFNKKVWTHNDSKGEPALYSIDKVTGDTVKKVTISNATNKDWEDVTQDDKYIYIGNMGNNANGNRTDLKIYRVKKSDVKKKTIITASVINYSYEDQTDFTATGSNHTNFDCEALIAYGDSLFLFSKDWVDNKTRLYKLPKLPGTYTATKIGELNVEGLITGAEIVADKKVIVLTGYNAVLAPFIYLLYDFTDNLFFDANKRKIALNQSLTQVEGICSVNEKKFYISNERVQKIFTVPAKLQTINLGSFLNPYYNHLPAKKIDTPVIAQKKSLQHNYVNAIR